MDRYARRARERYKGFPEGCLAPILVVLLVLVLILTVEPLRGG